MTKFIKKLLNEKGEYHSEAEHAVEFSDGQKEWWVNGKLHREDGPAIEHGNGAKTWYNHGLLHRIGGPTYVDKHNESKEWYVNDELHRDDGPAVEDIVDNIFSEGQLVIHEGYWQNGLKHREDGPAVITKIIQYSKLSLLIRDIFKIPLRGKESIVCEWWFNGKLHREDGPAIKGEDGHQEYWINGEQLTEEKFYLFEKLEKGLVEKKDKDKKIVKI